VALGLFDTAAVPQGWFDETAQPLGWFDDGMLAQAAPASTWAGAPLPAIGLLFQTAAGGAAITLQSDGSLLYKAAPDGGDDKLYLATSGEIIAKTSPGAGDRRISLSGGAWLAN
jgi:hypothetical protein